MSRLRADRRFANALGPAGRPYARTDATHQRGITADRCARAILRGVAAGREEIVVGGREVLAIYLKRFVPWLYSRIVRRLRFSVAET